MGKDARKISAKVRAVQGLLIAAHFVVIEFFDWSKMLAKLEERGTPVPRLNCAFSLAAKAEGPAHSKSVYMEHLLFQKELRTDHEPRSLGGTACRRP